MSTRSELLELADELDILSQEFFSNRPTPYSDEDDILFMGVSAGYEAAAKKAREYASSHLV